jgi:site-specific DNA-methyltransferase (adenine-specific)
MINIYLNYIMNIQLYNGDCLTILKDISTNTIDLVICDLPYGQTNCKWDNRIDLVSLWNELKRVGKPNTAYIFFTTTRFGYELIKSNEKWFRYDLVWSKNSTAGFLNAKKMPLRTHEMIYVFYNKLPIYNIQEHHIHKPKLTKKHINNGSVYGKNDFVRVTGAQWQPKLPSSIIDVPINKFNKSRFHPTEKPVELLEWIIKYYSKEGYIILDPTMGSGSTGVACKNLNRSFIGIELTKEYYDIACTRLDYF